MLRPRFHSLGRYAPFFLFQIKLGPFCGAKLCGADKGQDEQPQGVFRDCVAVVAIELLEKLG